MIAFAQDIDGRIAEQLVDAAESSGGGGTVTGTGSSAGDQQKAFRAARRVLSAEQAPEQRALLRHQPGGQREDHRGQPRPAGEHVGVDAGAARRRGRAPVRLRHLRVRRVRLGSGDKGQADGVAFHRSAVHVVNRTLQAPMGLAPSQYSVTNDHGIGLRVVYAYDVDKKQDVISVDTLFGLSTIRKTAAVQLDFGLGS
jgi:hypothetical protein